jgi:acylpyruvate hydrolase
LFAILQDLLRSRRGQSSVAFAVAMAAQLTKLGRLLRSGRKVVCVGKNYEEHITELAHLSPNFNRKTDNSSPMIFLKPTTSYAFGNAPVRIARGRVAVHYEVELGVLVGQRIGPDDSEAMSEEEIMGCIAGYCVAIDMTDRDLQTAAKKQGGCVRVCMCA